MRDDQNLYAVALSVDSQANPILRIVLADNSAEALGKVLLMDKESGILMGYAVEPMTVDIREQARSAAIPHLLQKRKIAAVKVVRDIMNCSLNEAKVFVDTIKIKVGIDYGEKE